jgi:hypothetical protein
MKKKFLTGLIALLSLSLFFLGCPSGSDDDDDEETFTTVTGYTTASETDLTVTAKKSNSDGTVYVTVTGTVTGVADFTANPNWGATPWMGATGKWEDVIIDLAPVLTDNTKFYAIKSTSQAYRYYTGGGGILASAPTEPVTTSGSNIYIPANAGELPVKWRIYNANVLTADTEMLVMLWSGANPKTVTLEIAEYASFDSSAAKVADVAKIVIDYSGVTIQ